MNYKYFDCELIIADIQKNGVYSHPKYEGRLGLADSPNDGIFFHGFSKPEYLLMALQKGEFGDKRLTSIGVKDKSHVPLYHRIYFKKNKAKIYPILYGDYSRVWYGPDEEPDPNNPIVRAAKWLGINYKDVEIGPMQYRNENEWYSHGKVKLSDIEVIMVSIPERAIYKEIAQEIKKLCQKLHYPFMLGIYE